MRNPWKQKYHALKYNSSKLRDKEFKLSFEDFMTLVEEAGIKTPDQIGRKIGQYQMGRIGDTGPYEIGNCRYILFEQNQKEAVENNRTAKNPDILGKVAKRFLIHTPEGTTVETHNVSEFCRQRGLSQGSMSMMLRGEIPSFHGYTGKYI